MTALTVTPKDVSADWNRGSIVENYQTGAAVAVGDTVYIDSSNLVQKADANTPAVVTARGVGIVVNGDNIYGETSIASGAWAAVCLHGPVYGFSGLSAGQFGWVSATPGEIDDTAPTGGAYQFVVGHAISSDTFFVQPGQAQPSSV